MRPIHRLGLVVLTGCLAGLLAERTPHMAAFAGITKGEPSCPGDTNGDFVVNGADLSVLLGNFGAVCPGPPCAGDLNGDNLVNGADLAVLLATFGNTCQECTFSTDCPPRPNATMACLNFQCVIAGCNPGFADCDGDILNGCETNTGTSLNNCGGCGLSCVAPNATMACVNSQCVLVGCDPGFANCDGIDSNGCETNISTDVNNCGSCGFSCIVPNGISTCVEGSCFIAVCPSGRANCDGINSNGCEINIDTDPNNCGGCGISCSLPNATSSCVSGSCSIASCNLGFSNCDGNIANGCELNHNQSLNSCAGAEYLGAHCGDLNCGFLCPTAARGIVASRQSNRERWFRVRNEECASCSSPIRHVVRLTVPPGINYDLFVYSACGGALIGSSTAGTGATELVVVQRSDSPAGDDSFDYWVEVRYFSGSSCGNWQLTIEASPGC